MVSASLDKKYNSLIDLFDKNRSVLIYTEGAFGLEARKKMAFRAKTADGILRYAKYNIAGVIDSKCQEKKVSEVLGKKFSALGSQKDFPIFKNIKSGWEKTGANVLLIGIAPEGGAIPQHFLNDLEWALDHGFDLINGMHEMISSFPKLKEKILKNKRLVWETRFPVEELPIASCRVYQEIKKPIVLTVGTDAAIGKLTTTYQLAEMIKKNGYRPQIIPTGQTAIMIEGWGYCVDKCEGDFMAGAVEKMILEKEKESHPDIYLVEGQGSLFHPAYSTTSLALIHGACPTHLILVHRPSRKRVTGCPLLAVPKIKTAIETYENAVMPPFRKTRVVAIALNTFGMNDNEAKKIIAEIKEETGLPTADLIRQLPSSSAGKEDWTKLFLK